MNGQPVIDPAAVSDSGTYVIRAIDENGCADESLVMVTEAECRCVADFTHDAPCLQKPAQSMRMADPTVVDAQWEFGDAAIRSYSGDPVVRFTS
jgi:hypothetical protein